ncbi:MAG TPA: hypothetical protein VIZ17_23440 [Acetobacteraceae bacterium]
MAAGVGISLVAASMREIHLGGVRYLRLQKPGKLRAPLTVGARSQETRPTVENLLRLSRDMEREQAARRAL